MEQLHQLIIKTGDVQLNAEDVGASEIGHTHSYNDLTNKPTKD